MNTQSVSDRHYKIDGVDYDRITSVIGDTLGGQSVEAGACEVAKYASTLFESHQNGEIYQKPTRLWDGEKFVDSFEDVMPSNTLEDYRRLQGAYYHIRQGWLDRGTVLNLWFDRLAEGVDPTPNNAYNFVNEELASWREMKGPTPICYQCNRDDVIPRAMWLARLFRDEKPIIASTQQTVRCEETKVAGTLDAIGSFDEPGVIELKAGSEQFSHQVQVSIYKKLLAGENPLSCYIVYIRLDGYRIVKLTDDQVLDGVDTFHHILHAYRSMRQKRTWATLSQKSDKKLLKAI